MLTAFKPILTNTHEADRFRIRIWTGDENGAETMVYDNQMGAPNDSELTIEIGSGSLIINKAK